VTDSPGGLKGQRIWLERIAGLMRAAWARTQMAGRILAHFLLTGVEFIRLKRRARTLQSEIRAHFLYLGQLVVRLHREEGEQSGFESFTEVKSEIESISRREAKLKKLAIEIADVRTEFRRPSD
jgi:hypothetical protein